MFTVNHLAIYFGVLFSVLLIVSLWINWSRPGTAKQRARSGFSTFVQLTVCSVSYSVFFFVLMLAIGIGVWLLLLGLIYLPADVLNNVLGDRWTQTVVTTIKPYVNRSWASPGLFHQPILDTATLSTLLFAPLAALRTVISRSKQQANTAGALGEFKFRKTSV